MKLFNTLNNGRVLVSPGRMGVAECVPAVALSGGLVVAYGPLLAEFAAWQAQRPHYHASVLPLAAFLILIAWRACHAPLRSPPVSRRPWGLLATSWVLLAAAVWVHSPLAACLSALMLAGAGCRLLESRRHISNLWGIWALLWLVVPIPLGHDRLLIASLQRLSSQLSSQALDALGVLHLMEGNRLSLAGQELLIDEACSGIVSVLLMVSVATIYGVVKNRPLLHVVLLALSGIAWAMVLNAGRIAAIALAWEWFDWDWHQGATHEMVGAVAALLAVALTFATDRLLLAVCGPIEQEYEAVTASSLHFGQRLVAVWDRMVQLGPSAQAPAAHSVLLGDREQQTQGYVAGGKSRTALWGLVPLVIAGGFTWVVPAPSDQRSQQVVASLEALERAKTLTPQVLETGHGAWEVTHQRFEHREAQHLFGEHSVIYELRSDEGMPLVVSCDFPFAGGWHEVSVCYQGIGWELLERHVRQAEDSAKFVETHFRTPDGALAVVLYCAFDAEGNAIEPPSQSLRESLSRVLRRRQATALAAEAYQVQVQLTGPMARDERNVELASMALSHARRQFLNHITQPATDVSP